MTLKADCPFFFAVSIRECNTSKASVPLNDLKHWLTFIFFFLSEFLFTTIVV